MKIFLILLIQVIELFATAPAYNWTNPLKECANIILEKDLDHNVTKEELKTITEFKCNYSNGEIELEAVRDLVNVESLIMRGNTIIQYVESENLDTNITSIVKVSGNFPYWIGELTSLKILDLSGNNLSGNIPDSIALLTNLEKLDLSVNKISKIPPAIGSLSSLKELHLASCSLVQQLPPELGNLMNLEKLYLQDNRLHGEIPAELGDLMFLTKLRLNQNNLKGNIPVELMDLDLAQPSGLGLHENCNLNTDDNDTISWIDSKSSLYRGYDGMRSTGGNCWTPAMVPIIMYLLSD